MKIKKIEFARISSRFRDGEITDVNDMLRYDLAFRSEAIPDFIMFPVFQMPAGNLGGRVTRDRWRSYGIDVIMILEPELVSELRASLNPDKWVTYQHVGTDRTLVPFTLAQYVAAKNTYVLTGGARA